MHADACTPMHSSLLKPSSSSRLHVADDCGVPLAEDTDTYQLPPITSLADIPPDFNPELACSFALAKQARRSTSCTAHLQTLHSSAFQPVVGFAADVQLLKLLHWLMLQSKMWQLYVDATRPPCCTALTLLPPTACLSPLRCWLLAWKAAIDRLQAPATAAARS